MSRIYDCWEKLVGAVLRREKDRQLALFESFSSSSSADLSSRFSFSFSFSSNSFFADARVAPVSGSDCQRVDPADRSSENTSFYRNVVSIEYDEIKKATKNFRPDMLWGVGELGLFYKGWLHEQNLTAVKPGSGIVVAVKKLKHDEFQGNTEWLAEINYLGQLHHPNLIKLIGYSSDTDNRVLIYEFTPRGSLDNHLFRVRHQSLPWATRIKVATGVARALAFLHGLEMPVIHRNINTSDIFLDGDFNAKLSDFGLARDGPTDDTTHVSTRVMGTLEYAAPEYIATGLLTTRCDVYSFGVVFLEIISGLRVLDTNRAVEMHNLIDWARPYLKDEKRLLRVVDSRLEGQYPVKEVYKVGKIALQSLSYDPMLRPTMSEVVAELEQL